MSQKRRYKHLFQSGKLNKTVKTTFKSTHICTPRERSERRKLDRHKECEYERVIISKCQLRRLKQE